MISHACGYFLHIHSMTIFSFLIISGYFDNVKKNKSVIEIVKKRFLQTMIYYFYFSFITLPFFLHGKSISDIEYIIRYIFNGIGPQELLMNFPLWFLPYFFSLMVIYDIIYLFSYKLYNKLKLNNEIYVDVISLICILVITYMSYIYIVLLNEKKLIYNIDFSCMSIIFPFIGKIIKDYKNVIKNKIKLIFKKEIFINFIYIIFFLLITILWDRLTIKNKHIDLVYRIFGENIFLLYINAILGYIFLYGLSKLFLKIKYVNKILSYVGKNSISFLSYHIPATIVFSVINFIFPASFIKIIYGNQTLYNITIVLFMFLFSVFMIDVDKSIKFIINKRY